MALYEAVRKQGITAPTAQPSEAADIAKLREAIQGHLRSQGVYGNIRSFVRDFLREHDGFDPRADEDQLISALHERGVIENVARSLGNLTTAAAAPAAGLPPNAAMGGGSLTNLRGNFLHLQLLGGRGFMDSPNTTDTKLTLHVCFHSQRYLSAAVDSCRDPAFGETFLLDLMAEPTTQPHSLDGVALVAVRAPITFVVVRETARGDRSLVGYHRLEWRRIIPTGWAAMSIELAGLGSAARVPAGVLEVRLELLPQPQGGAASQSLVDNQLQAEREHEVAGDRRFLGYVKQWWREFVRADAAFENRNVRIIARNELGASRPVVSFVSPTRADECLDSPWEAARFVSLIPLQKEEDVGGHKTELWMAPQTTLCLRAGDVHDHATLLCSLLIGFGLDAYVCVGTDTSGEAVWVCTLERRGEVVFWNSCTGSRFVHPTRAGNAAHSYLTIGCCFNQHGLWANRQPSDSVDRCQFGLKDKQQWHPLDAQLMRDVVVPTGPCGLRPPIPDRTAVQRAVAHSLRERVARRREDVALTTRWDDAFSYLMAPALASYESERLLGTAVSREGFEGAVSRSLPAGHSFKGCPFHFDHSDPQRMMQTIMGSQIGRQTIETEQAPDARIGLCVRVFAYPEQTVACWVMISITLIDGDDDQY